MGLEATVICVDNSNWSRNGDYVPSRFEAQQDAANLIGGRKMQENPESSVGVITMANSKVEVVVPPTADLGRMLKGVHGIQLGGRCDVVRAMQTALLALKHRSNKNQRQRIILFICSPLTHVTDRAFTNMSKSLKKNNVSLDIISFGDCVEHNRGSMKLLMEFVEEGSSNMTEILPGTGLLSDKVAQSPVLRGVAGDIPNDDLGLGVDPDADPELYMALRMSLEEEQARRARESGGQQPPTAEAAEGSASALPLPPAATPAAGDESGDTVSASILTDPSAQPTAEDIANLQDIDDELRQALLMSLQHYQEEQGARQQEEGESPEGTEQTKSSTNQEDASVDTQRAEPPSETRETVGDVDTPSGADKQDTEMTLSEGSPLNAGPLVEGLLDGEVQTLLKDLEVDMNDPDLREAISLSVRMAEKEDAAKVSSGKDEVMTEDVSKNTGNIPEDDKEKVQDQDMPDASKDN